jgi:hypothetical protein
MCCHPFSTNILFGTKAVLRTLPVAEYIKLSKLPGDPPSLEKQGLMLLVVQSSTSKKFYQRQNFTVIEI